MTPSLRLDELTGTFSADRSYCDHLFNSPTAENAARIFIYYKWARSFLPHFQEGLLAIAPKHFASKNVKIAEFWTAALTGGILKDICLVAYLVMRGMLPEAGPVLRRSLEHAGVLTHFWYAPAKASFLTDSDSKDFERAFLFETDRSVQKQLRTQGIKKRFSSISLSASAASTLYKILSHYDIHGGTPLNVLSAAVAPTNFSCGFVNRNETDEFQQLNVLAQGCHILCLEVAFIHGTFGKRYNVTPTEVGVGGRLLHDLLDSHRMGNEVSNLLRDLRRVSDDDVI